MSEYVDSAVFIYDPAASYLLKYVMSNTCATAVKSVSLSQWLQDPTGSLNGAGHVVIAASIARVKQLMLQSREGGFSVGILPIEGHKRMAHFLNLPESKEVAVELALSKDPPDMDIVLCNGEVLLFRATFGWLPLLDAPPEQSRLRAFGAALVRMTRFHMQAVTITTDHGKRIKTSAVGCMVLQQHQGALGSRLAEKFINIESVNDGTIGLLVNSPRSILQYLGFIFQLTLSRQIRQLPSAVGFVRSRRLTIETDQVQPVFIDGARATTTPLRCEVIPDAVKVNVGPLLKAGVKGSSAGGERVKIDNLPNENELSKSLSRRIPFFTYASEDRYRDLFKALRGDATCSANYVVLMILSTMLATVGLYLNNAAVIIGAMLLAPLMAPLVSVSMGILRANDRLFFAATRTIGIGIAIALFSACVTTIVISHHQVTDEMIGRLNPTLLDLAVAILSGIAAAYSKSHRELAQNLAGVAIAVALVPPLAVAGIGLGQGDLHFFLQAFLLFLTNMVGIIVAAMITFRLLGYSPVVRGKRGVTVIFLLLALISVPLYLSYHQIIDRVMFEQNLETDRFLVNGKYLSVDGVRVSALKGRPLLIMDVLTREPLSRQDMLILKKKLQNQFDKEIYMHMNIIYLL